MFPRICGGCGKVRPQLQALFLNGLGWRQRCAKCCAPPAGPARAYVGPYPITAAMAAPVTGNPQLQL